MKEPGSKGQKLTKNQQRFFRVAKKHCGRLHAEHPWMDGIGMYHVRNPKDPRDPLILPKITIDHFPLTKEEFGAIPRTLDGLKTMVEYEDWVKIGEGRWEVRTLTLNPRTLTTKIDKRIEEDSDTEE